MCKILQTKLQKYVKQELPDVQGGFGKGRGTRDQIANILWIIQKARKFHCFIDYTKAFDYVDNNKMWGKKRDGKTRPPYLCSEKLVCRIRRNRTLHRTTDWFKIGKHILQGCISSPCSFNLHAEYIMQNARLDDSQAGSKIARRNINNLSYAGDTTLMAESKDEFSTS